MTALTWAGCIRGIKWAGCICGIEYAALTAVFGIAWTVRKFRAGPGPDSRLERLLRDIAAERGET